MTSFLTFVLGALVGQITLALALAFVRSGSRYDQHVTDVMDQARARHPYNHIKTVDSKAPWVGNYEQ